MIHLPNYEVVESECTPECLVIRDIGPWDRYPTITNRAEEVILMVKNIRFGRRLEYYDSEGHRDQILIKDGKFAGFSCTLENYEN